MNHQPDPVVTTAQGPVRGLRQDGVAAFLTIPYAAPPRGAARFAPLTALVLAGCLASKYSTPTCFPDASGAG